MESESDHDHRDDESASEHEEIEETKPKSALKKGRDAPPPVERPHLPYVFRTQRRACTTPADPVPANSPSRAPSTSPH